MCQQNIHFLYNNWFRKFVQNKITTNRYPLAWAMPMDIKFNKNEDHNKLLLSDLKKRLAKVKLGGGEKSIAKHHGKGKMTARERIDYLLDPKSKSIEIGAFAGEDMYENYGGCPSGGVVVKIGYVKVNNVL